MTNNLASAATPADPNSRKYPGECNNPEVFAPDLTVTEVVVEVDTAYGPYG
jgi:hypothetical protein